MGQRSKQEFVNQLKNKKLTPENRPLLFAVIQGGNNKTLREKCAQALLDIGFDGYGFGWWPLDEGGAYNYDILEFTSKLIPDNHPKYALGIGNPQAVFDCVKLG